MGRGRGLRVPGAAPRTPRFYKTPRKQDVHRRAMGSHPESPTKVPSPSSQASSLGLSCHLTTPLLAPLAQTPGPPGTQGALWGAPCWPWPALSTRTLRP